MTSMRERRHERSYLIFGEVPVKWFWAESELVRFREMWNDGEHIQDIAKSFRTNKRSIALLIMDQAENDKIKQRKRGLF